MTDKDSIVITEPAGTKARWVRQSQRESKKLSAWIVEKMETSMHQKITTVCIPADLPFSALKLAREADGSVSFDRTVIGTICHASGIDPALFFEQPEDNVSSLITAWYRQHLAAGGAPDPVQQDLIAEVAAEDAAGQHYSHSPGRA